MKKDEEQRKELTSKLIVKTPFLYKKFTRKTISNGINLRDHLEQFTLRWKLFIKQQSKNIPIMVIVHMVPETVIIFDFFESLNLFNLKAIIIIKFIQIFFYF